MEGKFNMKWTQAVCQTEYISFKQAPAQATQSK